MHSYRRPFYRRAGLLVGAALYLASGFFFGTERLHPRVARGCTTTGTVTAVTSIVNNRAIGGVSIDPDGVLNNAVVTDQEMLRKVRQEALRKIPNEMNDKVTLRKVSLAKLEAAAHDAIVKGRQIPDEVRYLAGLQRIQYVFVYPDQHDVVLAGPGEGWKVNDQGAVVGVTTGRPVLSFDDLLVALRTAPTTNNGGMTCSIDPTAEGMTRLTNYQKSQGRSGSHDPQEVAAQYEEMLGPQTISVTGVPASTHFARVMVAADYKMKRLAMKFDESPVRGLPSYLEMIASGSGTGPQPRWWLAMAYEPLAKAADGLSWELRGQGVKAMAEEDFFSSTGNRAKTVKAGAMVQKWADNMTSKYDELAGKEPIFAELRNCMDLAVIGALIVRENLLEKAGCAIPSLMDNRQLPTEEYFPPKQVASKASFVRKSNGYLFTTSGGVQMLPWQATEKPIDSDKLDAVRDSALPKGDKWWWN